MDFSGLDKIKINNAVIVFLVVVNCFCLPLLTVGLIDIDFYFRVDLIKLLLMLTAAGTVQFAFSYLIATIELYCFNFNRQVETQENINYVIRWPIITASTVQIIYFFLMFIAFGKVNDIDKNAALYITCYDTSILIYLIIRGYSYYKKQRNINQ